MCANTFSHTINPNHSFPLPHFSQLGPFPSSSNPLPFISSSQKRRTLKTTANRTKQDIMRKGRSLHIEAGQGNPIGRKGSQEQAVVRYNTHFHCYESYKKKQIKTNKSQAKIHTIYTEDLMHTLEGPVLAMSVSVSPLEPCMVSWGPCSPSLLIPTIFPSPLPQDPLPTRRGTIWGPLI